MAVTRERKGFTGRVRKPKEKMYSAEGAKASLASWAEREAVAHGEERAGMGRHGPVGLDHRKNSNGN
jgi:hypothetical protein